MDWRPPRATAPLGQSASAVPSLQDGGFPWEPRAAGETDRRVLLPISVSLGKLGNHDSGGSGPLRGPASFGRRPALAKLRLQRVSEDPAASPGLHVIAGPAPFVRHPASFRPNQSLTSGALTHNNSSCLQEDGEGCQQVPG